MLKMMTKAALATSLLVGLGAGVASANEALSKLQQNPADWTMPTGDYANTRYSKLEPDQPAANVARPEGRLDVLDRRAARSRGRAAGDRRHDVRPHAVPEQRLCARPSNDNGKIIWKYEPKQDPNVIPVMCCDTVNRGVAYGRRQDLSCIRPTPRWWRSTPRPARSSGRVKNGDPEQGRDRHVRPDGRSRTR